MADEMIYIPMRYRVDLDRTINTTPLNTLFAMGDNQAHRFELTITHGSVAEDLTGCEVKGKFVSFANNMTVILTGSVENGNAVVALKQPCYTQLGRFALTIQIHKNGAKTTVFYGDGYMRNTSTDNAIIDEDYIVYDTDVLLSKIQEIEAAISGANDAISGANAAADGANTSAQAASNAADAANAAADRVDTAIQAANTAAANADSKAAAADAATAAANTAADGANASTDLANTAAQSANAAAENAMSSADAANAAASAANAAAENVDANMDTKITARVDKTLSVENGIADAKTVGNKIGSLKDDLDYKKTVGLVPVQFETVLGYYTSNEFVSGKKEWGARLMRVQCKKGDKYLYHGYCDNIYGVSFLDSDFHIIRQISVPKNKEFEMDVNAIDNASYIDFYSASYNTKSYVLKYNREDTINNGVGKIFIDASSQLSETDNKYFSPTREELIDAKGMKLKEITPENDTVFKFSFTQHQSATAYVDDFCIVTSDDYINGTEVFKENIIVFVPKGKTFRINDYNSSVYTSKIEELICISAEYIDSRVNEIQNVADTVSPENTRPVSSSAVYKAIQSLVIDASTGLPFIAVASSEAPPAIRSVCQFVCDGTDDQAEIQDAISALAATGGKVFLTKGKFFISSPIDTGNTLIELCGEGALLDLHEDTMDSTIRGGTILQAVGNTDILHIGGAKGTTVHDIAFFGYGRNKADNTGYGIRFTGYADTDRIYNCGFTNCAAAIGSDIATDVIYIHNLSVQRNKIGVLLYKTDAEIHDCLFCENIGMETVVWDDNIYGINCADVCTNDGKIYNNTFRRSGMCYDIYKVYGNESGLESDDVKPISSVVVRQRAHIVGNKFFDCIYANCIRIMMKPDFLLIEGNSFTKWGHKDQTDDCRKSAICFDKGSVLGAIMNNRFYSDSNTQKFTDKYAIYECDIQYPNDYWQYSNTYANNFIGNLTADTENKCRIIGTASQNQFINNVVVSR